MEAILLLFAGLLEGLVLALSLVIPILFSMLMLLIQLVISVVSPVQLKKPSKGASTPESASISRRLRSIASKLKTHSSKNRKWIAIGFGVVGGLLGAFLIFIETVGFAPSVRFLAKRLRTTSGVEIQFSEVEGSFLKREFQFKDLEARLEKSDSVTGFDLSAGKVVGVFKGPVWSIPRTMSVLEIQDLFGTVWPAGKAAGEPKEGIHISVSLLNNRPGFTVEQLNLKGCELTLVLPETLEEVPISIPFWEISPLRTRFYAFDVLFRSNLEGGIGQGRVKIETRGEGDGRNTQWLGENLKIEWISAFLDPPWNRLADGRLDVEVHDAWILNENDIFIDLFWRLKFSELSLQEAEGGTLREKAVQKMFNHYLQEQMRNRNLELGFELRIQEGEISGSMSAALVSLFERGFAWWVENRMTVSDEKAAEMKQKAGEAGSWLRERWKSAD